MTGRSGMMTGPRIVFAIAFLALGACSGARDGDTGLRNLGGSDGTPDEFAIVPNKPLAEPPSFSELPAPTPRQANRADVTPLPDAVAALGGDPSRLARRGIPAGDGALVAAAGRNGVDAAIRQDLAEADAAFRRRASLFNWQLVPENEYNRAYRRQSLDPQAWLARVRRPGTNIRTPSAPPAAD